MSGIHHFILLLPALNIIVNEFLLQKNKTDKTQNILTSVFIVTSILETSLKIGPFNFITFLLLIFTLHWKFME